MVTLVRTGRTAYATLLLNCVTDTKVVSSLVNARHAAEHN